MALPSAVRPLERPHKSSRPSNSMHNQHGSSSAMEHCPHRPQAGVHLIGSFFGGSKKFSAVEDPFRQSSPLKSGSDTSLPGHSEAELRRAIAEQTTLLMNRIRREGGLRLDPEYGEWLRQMKRGGDGVLRIGDLQTKYGQQLCTRMALQAVRQSALASGGSTGTPQEPSHAGGEIEGWRDRSGLGGETGCEDSWLYHNATMNPQPGLESASSPDFGGRSPLAAGQCSDFAHPTNLQPQTWTVPEQAYLNQQPQGFEPDVEEAQGTRQQAMWQFEEAPISQASLDAFIPAEVDMSEQPGLPRNPSRGPTVGPTNRDADGFGRTSDVPEAGNREPTDSTLRPVIAEQADSGPPSWLFRQSSRGAPSSSQSSPASTPRTKATVEEKQRTLQERKEEAARQEKERVAALEEKLRAQKEAQALRKHEDAEKKERRKLEKEVEAESLRRQREATKMEAKGRSKYPLGTGIPSLFRPERTPEAPTLATQNRSRTRSGTLGSLRTDAETGRAFTERGAPRPEPSSNSPYSEPFGSSSPAFSDPTTVSPIPKMARSTSASSMPTPRRYDKSQPSPTKTSRQKNWLKGERWSKSNRLMPDVISLPYLTFVIGREPVRLLIDSGAQISLIQPALRKRLGLRYREAPGNLNGVTGTGACEGICEGLDGEGVELSIPGQGRGTSSEALFTKVKMVSGPCGQMCDGILGMPWIVAVNAEIRSSEQGVWVSFEAERRDQGRQRIDLLAIGQQELRKGSFWTANGLSPVPAPAVNRVATRGASPTLSNATLPSPALPPTSLPSSPLTNRPQVEAQTSQILRRSRSTGFGNAMLGATRARTFNPGARHRARLAAC